ncbi:MAG: hypothetical protein IJO60_09765 [Agathobacter sp.]|nr:hypothetical protein [Agathobacter sp.]
MKEPFEKLYVERLRNNPLAIELVEAALAFGKSDEWKQFYRSNELFYQKIIDGLTSLDLTKTYHLMEKLYGSLMPQEVECCYYKLYLPDEYEKALAYERKVGFKDIEFLVERYLKYLEVKDREFLGFYIETLQEFVRYIKG